MKAVSEDNQGNIWIPTEKGITKFDGKNFKTFTAKNGLPSNEVFFATTYGDTCWIYDYTPYMTYILRDSVRTMKIERNGRKNENFHKRYFSSANSIIINGSKENVEFVLTNKDSCKTINTIDFINNIPALKKEIPERYLNWRTLVDSTSVEVSIMKFAIVFDKKLVVYDFETGKVHSHSIDIDIPTAHHSMQPDIRPQIFSNYFIFLSSKPHILHFVNLDTFEDTILDLTAVHKKYKKAIMHLIERDTILKITSADNFYIEINKDLTITDTFQWYPDQKINCINRDRSGNYWISTNNEGVHIVQHHLLNFKKITPHFETSNILGLYRDSSMFFLFDDKSNLYITTKEYQLIKKIQLPVLHKSYPEISRYWFYPDCNDGYYIASAFGTYYLTKDFTLKNILHPKSLVFKDYCYDPDSRNLIIATNNGILRAKPGSLFANDDTKCPDHSRIMHIEQLKDGYVGTNDFGRVMLFSDDFELTKDIKLDKNISFSAVDEDDLILAIESEGIYKYNPSTNKNCFIAEDDNIQYYTQSKNGFWTANYRYINKTSYKRNNYSIIQKYLNTKGLLYNEIYNIADLDSVAYLLCDKGIIQLPGDGFSYNDSGFSRGCYVYSLSVGKKEHFLNRNDSFFRVDYSNKSITIRTTCNSTSFLGEVSNKYFIEGEHKDWTSVENSVISFPSLAPGNYKIHLKAVINNTDISSNETVFTLYIHPRWWQTIYLKIAIGVVLIILIVLIYRFRVKLIKEKAQREIELDRKVSGLELTALQSQMNPHFIFNSLTSIQSFINTHSTEAADNLLQKFSMLVRSYLDFSSKSHISLRQEINSLKLYTDIEKLRFNNKFDVEYHVRNTSNKTLDEIRIIPMLIQPLVENAINHGIYHLENNEGIVKIFFLISNNSIIIVVDDNGVGRTAAISLRNKLFPALGNSLIKDRIAIINQSKRAEIIMDIIDKTSPAGMPAGTRIILKINTA